MSAAIEVARELAALISAVVSADFRVYAFDTDAFVVDPRFTRELRDRGIMVQRYEFSGDYYTLPNLLPLLALPSQVELVDVIMSLPLPRRPERVA